MHIGTGELIVVLVVALIIFGPSKLPALGKMAGKAVGTLRHYADSNNWDELLEEEEEEKKSGKKQEEKSQKQTEIEQEAEPVEEPAEEAERTETSFLSPARLPSFSKEADSRSRPRRAEQFRRQKVSRIKESGS